MTDTFEKTAVELERDIAPAVAELRRHGGTDADVEALRQQFRAMAEDEDNRLDGKPIQD